MSKRQERKLRRKIKDGDRDVAINVVSLIDIFAILVFYLLVNALVVEVIPEYQNLILPSSIASDNAKRTATVAVSENAILLDERRIMSLDEALASEDRVLSLLVAALRPLGQMADSEAGVDEQAALGRDVNIVADQKTPYRILKKILATCVDAGFDQVSLAVREIAPGGGA
ncbi:ExbD/TolR family protein [Zhongshania sp.]|uniref:ExbD/TolR family protein n=1 Tax=Zhongshania sp. TaxID=1971902 RepID=UPI0035655B03